jgi:hypothetical protein
MFILIGLFIMLNSLDEALGLRTTSYGSSINAEDIIRVRASTDETQSTFVQWQGQTL